MSTCDYDICVIGGGIIGAAVARDAAGRGLTVYLAERNDFAGGTSSASSKLIHGGLRYLETWEFRMVREGLLERRILQNMAPHLVHPLKFLVPLANDAPRPAWMVRLGLWLYDFLAGSKRFADSGSIPKSDIEKIIGLKPGRFQSVLQYTDGWGDDARLTIELIRDAQLRGANVSNYRTVEKISPIEDGYQIDISEKYPARHYSITARVIMNAAGPFANHVIDLAHGEVEKPHALRWVRGSHIVLPMPEGEKIEHALTVQRPDNRVVFVLPWLEKYLIVGTTDIEQSQDTPVACSADERAYLLEAYNEYCAPSRSDNEIVYTWAGVRPLVDDGEANASKVSRDFTFSTHRQGKGGMLTIYGGKLTVHRILAEEALDRAATAFDFSMAGDWTATSSLPRIDQELSAFLSENPERQVEILPGIRAGHVGYCVEREFVRSAEDFLFRRTKLGIGLTGAQQAVVTCEIESLLRGKSDVTEAAE